MIYSISYKRTAQYQILPLWQLHVAKARNMFRSPACSQGDSLFFSIDLGAALIARMVFAYHMFSIRDDYTGQ